MHYYLAKIKRLYIVEDRRISCAKDNYIGLLEKNQLYPTGTRLRFNVESTLIQRDLILVPGR